MISLNIILLYSSEIFYLDKWKAMLHCAVTTMWSWDWHILLSEDWTHNYHTYSYVVSLHPTLVFISKVYMCNVLERLFLCLPFIPSIFTTSNRKSSIFINTCIDKLWSLNAQTSSYWRNAMNLQFYCYLRGTWLEITILKI